MDNTHVFTEPILASGPVSARRNRKSWISGVWEASVMTTANLAQYSVVILNNSTESGKFINIDQRAALLEYMKKGGFIGFHGAGDTKGSWPD